MPIQAIQAPGGMSGRVRPIRRIGWRPYRQPGRAPADLRPGGTWDRGSPPGSRRYRAHPCVPVTGAWGAGVQAIRRPGDAPTGSAPARPETRRTGSRPGDRDHRGDRISAAVPRACRAGEGKCSSTPPLRGKPCGGRLARRKPAVLTFRGRKRGVLLGGTAPARSLAQRSARLCEAGRAGARAASSGGGRE